MHTHTAYDTIIIGAGIAGLSCALSCDKQQNVLLVSLSSPTHSGSTPYAQGGIAFSPEHETPLHIKDTIVAGAGLCDDKVVSGFIQKSQHAIDWLQSQSVVFDSHTDGSLDKCREAGHNENRIIHIGGDATGKGIVQVLFENVRAQENITYMDGSLSALYRDKNNIVCGVDINGTKYTSTAVVFATGGNCGLFGDRTAPAQTSTAFKLAMDVGCEACDMEFFQHHPTALDLPDEIKGHIDRLPLISEAIRGHGAVLKVGKSDLDIPHPDKSLAPRDVVSRAVFQARQQGKHVYLDTQNIENFSTLFPNIANTCKKYDVNYRKIPVRSAVHYQIGGIKTDIHGKTNVDGLYVIGEASATGLHGANRLASNSLLEACIMGLNCAKHIQSSNIKGGKAFEKIHGQKDTAFSIVQTINNRSLGIVRHHDTLRDAILTLQSLPQSPNVVTSQMANLFALLRTESIGAHYRKDYTDTKNMPRQGMHLNTFKDTLKQVI